MPPQRFLAPYKGVGEVAAPLVGFLVAGVGLSCALMLSLAPESLRNDPSPMLARLRSIGMAQLPAAIAFAVALVTVVAHVAAALVGRILSYSRSRFEPRLKGDVGDSLNAAFAFSSVYIPAVCIFLLLLYPRARVSSRAGLFVLLMAMADIAFLMIYLPWCISSVHPDTTYSQAAVAVWCGVAGIATLSRLYSAALWQDDDAGPPTGVALIRSARST